MSLFARLDRNDIAALVVDLIERPIEGGDQLADGSRLEGDFVLSPFGNDENKLASDFNFGRGRPEITLSHAYTPDSLIRRTVHDSFVINPRYPNEKNTDTRGVCSHVFPAWSAQDGQHACALTTSAATVVAHTAAAFSIARTG